MPRTFARHNVVLIGLFILLSASQANYRFVDPNVWISHGPGGGDVRAIAIDPKTPMTLYAGTSGGGVFKSINSGETGSLSIPAWLIMRCDAGDQPDDTDYPLCGNME